MGELARLLILVLIVYAVWHYGKRIIADATNPRPAPEPPPNQKRPGSEDMTRCPVCASYVTETAPGCGRPDCPRAVRA